MFHALVVLGSGLAGCGGRASSDADVTERQVTDEGTNTDESSAADESAASDDDASEDESATSVDDTASATDDANNQDDTNGNDDATADDASSTDDSSEDDASAATDDTNSTNDASSGDDSSATDDTVIVVEPPDSTDLPAAPWRPDDCPPAQWQCAVEGCFSGPSCIDVWDETIESCLLAPPEGCTCAPEPAPQPNCGDEEVYTCAAGRFEGAGDAGAAQVLAFDCHCVPRGSDCSDACYAHPIGGYNRACVEEDGLVLCGGCIWTGILR